MTPSPLATLPPSAAAVALTRMVPFPVRTLERGEPLAGFPRQRSYVLVPADTAGRLFWLQSLDPDGPRFLVVPPAPYFPDYAPAAPPAACAELGLESLDDADLYCLVSVPDGDVAAATANLRAPVVVNRATQQARQLVLPDSSHPIGRPLRR